MVKDEDNVICEDCNTKGLIEHGIQILKNQQSTKRNLLRVLRILSSKSRPTRQAQREK